MISFASQSSEQLFVLSDSRSQGFSGSAVQFWHETQDTMPHVAPLRFARAEIIHVLKGAVDIKMPDRKVIHLEVGDVGAFDQNIAPHGASHFRSQRSILP